MAARTRMKRKKKRRAIRKIAPAIRAERAPTPNASFADTISRLTEAGLAELELLRKIHWIRNLARPKSKKVVIKIAPKTKKSAGPSQDLSINQKLWTPENFWRANSTVWFLFAMPAIRFKYFFFPNEYDRVLLATESYRRSFEKMMACKWLLSDKINHADRLRRHVDMLRSDIAAEQRRKSQKKTGKKYSDQSSGLKLEDLAKIADLFEKQLEKCLLHQKHRLPVLQARLLELEAETERNLQSRQSAISQLPALRSIENAEKLIAESRKNVAAQGMAIAETIVANKEKNATLAHQQNAPASEVGIFAEFEKQIVKLEALAAAGAVRTVGKLNPDIFADMEHQVHAFEELAAATEKTIADLPPIDISSLTIEELKNAYTAFESASNVL